MSVTVLPCRSLLLLKSTSRNWQTCLRNFSSFTEGRAAEEVHASATVRTWKRISLAIALPVVGYLTWKHIITGEQDHQQKEYFSWPHLRIRNKPFPWREGDKTLFHNPKTNPGPATEVETVTRNESQLKQLWAEYLLEDPERRDRVRWEHLARMQQRREEYLAKKAAGEKPLQPMDYFTEIKQIPVNTDDSEIDN